MQIELSKKQLNLMQDLAMFCECVSKEPYSGLLATHEQISELLAYLNKAEISQLFSPTPEQSLDDGVGETSHQKPIYSNGGLSNLDLFDGLGA